MAQRLRIILKMLGKREIVLIIDDTGDRKKGKKTAYVKRQYIGNLGFAVRRAERKNREWDSSGNCLSSS